ncbi:UNVERIFIED_CONTAM: hypothetical protein Scaly_0451600 [Sesamum calycinum]|uniref:Uncharacterized protein n=1 Tax=Sesamum calycinum TaxID=2727403 RepID=A0AAW2SFV8_9LAMI
MMIEKYALALMIAARKLTLYFQSQVVIALTDLILKQVLSKQDASKILVKWTIELGEYHVEFQPRTAIKAQVLADFLLQMIARMKKRFKKSSSFNFLARKTRDCSKGSKGLKT